MFCQHGPMDSTSLHKQMAGTDSKSHKKTLKSVGTEKSTGDNSGRPNSLTCRNLSCQDTLSIGDVFCKRCSCLFCHSFDEDKIPTDWLECSSEFGQGKSCGFSCHTKCALERGKVGAVNLGQPMELDGSYYCVKCRKIYGIIGYWKKLLAHASVETSVSLLCHRLELSYKLLDGSSKYRELHDIVKEAKFKLEREVGLLSNLAGTRPRGVIRKLSVAHEVQELCSAAITKADEWFAFQNVEAGLIPEACCGFLFEEVTSSSVTIALIELPTALASGTQCYKLWYRKAKEGTYSKEPDSVITRPERRFSIARLQPCTEYYFRVVSCNETGELGLSVEKFSTRSLDILQMYTGCSSTNNATITESSRDFSVRGVGKSVTWAQELGLIGGAFGEGPSNCCGDDQLTVPGALQCSPCTSSGLNDLKTLDIPILNESILVDSSREQQAELALLGTSSVVAPVDSSREEQRERALIVFGDAGVVGHMTMTHSLGEAENGAHQFISEEVRNTESPTQVNRKRPAEEPRHPNSIFASGSPSGIEDGAGTFGEKFDYCVKIIWELEKAGHINPEFGCKLLTWFGFGATENDRRAVYAFVENLVERPDRLAKQLIDAFSVISSKQRRKVGSGSYSSDK